MAIVHAPADVAERRASAMGTHAHVIVVGDTTVVTEAASDALRRIAELEQRWSRFRSDSEVSRLNVSDGEPVAVSADTVRLVTELESAWRRSGGSFDPSVGRALRALGYDRSFSEIGDRPPVRPPDAATPAPGLGDVVVDDAAGEVRLPAGLELDPGGLGKGLAADIVVAELLDRIGIEGALVSIGGDLGCAGSGPNGPGWAIEIGEPVAGVPDEVFVLDRGGIATSTPARRRWRSDGGWAHHLIDPRRCRPNPQPPAAVTVIAGRATDAEWIATAIAAGVPELLWRLDGDFTVVRTGHDGARDEHGPIRAFRR